jgi:hypothetical protein
MMPLFVASAISDSFPASIHGFMPDGILTLADAAVRALLVACLVGAGLRVMAPRHVLAQKTAWGLVLAGALLMPVLAPWAGKATWLPSGTTWSVPTHSWSQYLMSRAAAIFAAEPSREPQQAAPALLPAAVNGPAASPRVYKIDSAPIASGPADRFPAPTISHAQTAGAETSYPRPVHRGYYLPFSDLVWMIYGAVCLGFLLRLSYGLGGAIGLWQSAEPVSIDSHLADGLQLRCSRKITSPVTVGSAVVLPADFDEWDMEKLRIVLAHERSHVRQGDFYLQALAGVYAAIFWFSPLGWWLKRKLSDLSETISDHAGLEEAQSHASYAQILLEFAALPRRTQVGVAMAHSGRIAQRIERLLNESSFRQAFAGGRGRLWAALALVPAVLFAAAALIRVEAAQTLHQPVTTQGPVVTQSHPEIAPAHVAAPPIAVITAQAAAPQAPPANPTEAPAHAPAPPAHTPVQPAAPAVAPAPPAPGDADEDRDQEDTVTSVNARCDSSTATANHSSSHVSTRHGYSYAYSDNGDSYALVGGNGKDHVMLNGNWYDGRRAELDKARSMVHGDFLWFTRNGKSYVVDNPQIVAQIHGMYQPMEELGRKQEELGRQQEALGRQQAELGKKQQLASIPTPDVSHEMAALNASLAKLEAKKNGTVTMEQLAEIQSKIGELQGKLGGMQGDIGARQGELGRQQGLLGEQQGRLGEQQGRLGEQQGRIAREADRKVKSIIDQSLKDGKAKPVQ